MGLGLYPLSRFTYVQFNLQLSNSSTCNNFPQIQIQLLYILSLPSTQLKITFHKLKHSFFTHTYRRMNKQVVGVHDASKQIKKTNKKAQVKVVYISNPMKVNTSASQFRALVQQLTGRDADDMPGEEAFLEHSNVENQEQEQQVVCEEVCKDDAQAKVACVEDEEILSSDLLSLQDIAGYFSPSSFWYESAFHVDASKV